MKRLLVVLLLLCPSLCLADSFGEGFAKGLNKALEQRAGYSSDNDNGQQQGETDIWNTNSQRVWRAVNDYGAYSTAWYYNQSMCESFARNSGGYWVDCVLVSQ